MTEIIHLFSIIYEIQIYFKGEMTYEIIQRRSWGQAADIVIFAASETFAQTARELILERRLENHIAVTEATGERTLKLALQFAREGSRVFISRGGTQS